MENTDKDPSNQLAKQQKTRPLDPSGKIPTNKSIHIPDDIFIFMDIEATNNWREQSSL